MIIGKVKFICVRHQRPNFDNACLVANERALTAFGIDEFGHSTKVDFNRSTDSIRVKFSGYDHIATMVGGEYMYGFEAWIEREQGDTI